MSNFPKVAVTGCLPKLPVDFPIEMPENAGNMIHAQAPMRMFSGAVFSGDRNRPWGAGSSFRNWVNNESTHLVVTLANIFRLNREDGSSLARFQRSLESYDSELVVFGLGVQAPDTKLEDKFLSKEAIELMQYLGERCKVVGVRGEYTQKVFSHFAGVKNTYVTGCPSLFSRPEAIGETYQNWKNRKSGLRSYAGTNFSNDAERNMLATSIENRQYLVEPVSKANHSFFLDAIQGKPEDKMVIPYYLKGKVKNGELTIAQIADYYSRYYRLFRNTDAWREFYQEHVAFSYGSRFHVNMASLLAGVPAMWLTHDARTSELVEFLHLPNMQLEEASYLAPEEIEERYDPTEFFDEISSLFENFNNYLEICGLPPQELDF